MAKTHTANYVDRLLVKLDGALSPIWNSIFLSVNNLPNKDILFDVCSKLISETPRLRSFWDEQGDGWKEKQPTGHDLASVFNFNSNLQDKNERIHHIINHPINISSSFPMRLWIGLISENDEWLMTFQIHHAAGDGRSLLFIVQRFWDLLNKELHQHLLKSEPLAGPQMTDGSLLKKVWSNAKVISILAQYKYRQLSKRADALNHEAVNPGHPILHSYRINFHEKKHLQIKSPELFYSALLAAVALSEPDSEDKLIRLRIPVDLRTSLSINQPSIENACSAVILECSLNTLKSIARNQPEQLGLFLKNELKHSLQQKRYLANALECILISRLTSSLAMKKNARKEIISAKRSSSLVITHFGDVTEYIKPPHPIKINNVVGHTPVWGCNSYVYDKAMYLNFTCFDGIWNKEKIRAFANLGIEWMNSQYGLEGELL